MNTDERITLPSDPGATDPCAAGFVSSPSIAGGSALQPPANGEDPERWDGMS